jgi:hypothetical protein
MSPAAIITAVIQTAASSHCTPVDPLSLMDTRLGRYDHHLRSRLNAIITFHLHQNHKISYNIIARAYRLNPRTPEYRFITGKHLIKRSPWKQTYLKLP